MYSYIEITIMHLKSTWSSLNKELLAILSFLVISTLVSLVFLVHALLNMRDFTTQSTSAVGTTFMLQDMLLNVEDMETSVRGYVVTGDDSFLKPYNDAQKRLPGDIASIKNNHRLLLTAAQINELTGLVNKKTAALQSTLDAYRTNGFEAAQATMQTNHDDDVMAALRTATSSISSARLQNIGPMQRNSVRNLQRAIYVAGIMALLILGTCVAVAWYFKRAILHERALDSTKNEFLSLASHQLRTPATNVKQYLGLLMDGYMGDITDEQRKALSVAYRNNESEITIMNNLLDVAKLDLERIQLHKKVTNVVRVARRVVRDYAAQAKERNQKLQLEAPKQVMASVDETYIQGIIENLVDNGLKYSKENTRVTVSIMREQDNVLILVKDQGLGIRKRDFSKLFNKFSRLDNEFSANSQGSGLGLYWVKQIVNLHSGRIDFTSREGKGTTFRVSLPIR